MFLWLVVIGSVWTERLGWILVCVVVYHRASTDLCWSYSCLKAQQKIDSICRVPWRIYWCHWYSVGPAVREDVSIVFKWWANTAFWQKRKHRHTHADLACLGLARDLPCGGERETAPGVETGGVKKRRELNTDWLSWSTVKILHYSQ